MRQLLIAFASFVIIAFCGNAAFAADAKCGQKAGTAGLKIEWIITGANCSGKIQASDMQAVAALAAKGAKQVFVPMRVHKNTCKFGLKRVPVGIRNGVATVQPFSGMCVEADFEPYAK